MYAKVIRKDNPFPLPPCLHTPAVSSPEVIHGLGSPREGLIRVDEAHIRATSEITYMMLVVMLFMAYCWLTISNFVDVYSVLCLSYPDS